MAAPFMVSDVSSFITEHALLVDGGITVQAADATAAYVEKVC